MSNPLQTLKAIQVALKDLDMNNKSEMKLRLTIISGVVENALEAEKPEVLEYKEIYSDDTDILGTEDGI